MRLASGAAQNSTLPVESREGRGVAFEDGDHVYFVLDDLDEFLNYLDGNVLVVFYEVVYWPVSVPYNCG